MSSAKSEISPKPWLRPSIQFDPVVKPMTVPANREIRDVSYLTIYCMTLKL